VRQRRRVGLYGQEMTDQHRHADQQGAAHKQSADEAPRT
jgi:hypothetical protein